MFDRMGPKIEEVCRAENQISRCPKVVIYQARDVEGEV